MSHEHAVIYAIIMFIIGVGLMVRALRRMTLAALENRRGKIKPQRPDDAWYARPGFRRLVRNSAAEARKHNIFPKKLLEDESFSELTRRMLTAYESDPLVKLLGDESPAARALACRLAAFSTEPYFSEKLRDALARDVNMDVKLEAARALAARQENLDAVLDAVLSTLGEKAGKMNTEQAAGFCAVAAFIFSHVSNEAGRKTIKGALRELAGDMNSPAGTIIRETARMLETLRSPFD